MLYIVGNNYGVPVLNIFVLYRLELGGVRYGIGGTIIISKFLWIPIMHAGVGTGSGGSMLHELW